MGDLATAARSATLDRLERERFDCAVIGGGISGAGVAREASLRGLSVALLEAEDFASGTSSRSSKLIHGGMRYLAMGDVALVRTTALERKQIFRIAPHLAERRWMVIPVRSYASLLKFRAVITAYEKLGAVESADLHRNWGVNEIEREEPALDASVYKHACAYREYLTDDAHLVLANLRSAAGLGAAVLNHARVDAIVQEQDRAAGVEAVCCLSGRRVRVRARCVINAAGPWVEAVRRLESAAAPSLLHLSKGVHVVVTAERVPVRNLLILHTQDRRSIFVIRRGPCVVIGTTDTSYAHGADVWPEITREDVDYLLEPTARCLRGEKLSSEDVVGAWAGLRPLIAQPGKKPSEISRRDEVLVGPAGVVTMAGGKLTGYRPLARETIERAVEVASLRIAPAADEDPPLPGGDFDGDLAALEAALMRETGVSAVAAARLVRLHGTEAHDLAREGTHELVPGVLASEIDFAVRKEGAATLEDLLYRRLRTSLYGGSEREVAVLPAAERMARLLGWNAARMEAEMRGVRAQLVADLAFRDETPSGLARRGLVMSERRDRVGGGRLVGILALLLLAMSALILELAGTGESGLRMLVRATARSSLVLFGAAFAASSLRKLWRTPVSGWLLRQRRYLGLSFALSHALHALAIGGLALVLGDAMEVSAVTAVFGGGAYVMIALMAATSSDRAFARLGRRRWRFLHLMGVCWIWVIFAVSYTPRAVVDSVWYVLPAVLVWSVLGVRVAAWLGARRPRAAAAVA